MYAAPPTPSATLAQSEVAPRHTVSEHSCGDICPSGEAFAVSNNRHSHIPGTPLTDETREAAIVRAGRAVEVYMARVDEINSRNPHTFADFADVATARGDADRARRLMQLLIAGRSPEQVARMQASQDRRMANEPGATKEAT